MNACSKCGYQNDDDSGFCVLDGAPLGGGAVLYPDEVASVTRMVAAPDPILHIPHRAKSQTVPTVASAVLGGLVATVLLIGAYILTGPREKQDGVNRDHARPVLSGSESMNSGPADLDNVSATPGNATASTMRGAQSNVNGVVGETDAWSNAVEIPQPLPVKSSLTGPIKTLPSSGGSQFLSDIWYDKANNRCFDLNGTVPCPPGLQRADTPQANVRPAPANENTGTVLRSNVSVKNASTPRPLATPPPKTGPAIPQHLGSKPGEW